MNWKSGFFKRALSLVLAANMLLSNIPIRVFAQEDGTHQEAHDAGIAEQTAAVTAEVTEENLWEGRSAVFVGDSITAGTGTDKIYYEYLREELELGSVTAMGVAGSCISAASDYGQGNQPLINRYQSIPAADLVLVFMGTNDYGHETPLGTEDDTGDGTFYGALNVIIPALVAKHTSSKIVFVTPMHRYGFGTSKILGTQFTYDNIPNGAGATLGDYVNALKTVCASNSVTVIDLYSECTLDPSDAAVREDYMPDGLHPNAAGHEMIAGIIKKHIRDIVPPEKVPEVETDLVYGNRFADGYTQQNRASSRSNLYLKAGTVITFKDIDALQWACVKTDGENSSTNLGYFPDSAWTDKETATVTADGWVGFVFKYRDESLVFDLTKPLSDYIAIEEPHEHSYENGVCSGCGSTTSPYLQELPENITGCSNLYKILTPTKGYYTATKYDTSNGAVLSVVIPVEPGDRIAASSFGPVTENMGSVDGIRVTYLLDGTIIESVSASSVYTTYTQDGYLTVPAGVNMVSIPWWKPSDSNWLTLGQISKNFAVHTPKDVPAQAPTCTEKGYTAGEICELCGASLGLREEIPATGHDYNGNTCIVCGTVNVLAILDGKYVSILGDSISTFNGYSNDATVNSTIGGNGPRYEAGTADTKPGSYCLLESVDDTWWMHFANRSGMKLLVNNSWAGSQVFGGKTSDGRVIPAAYLERCINLHDDTVANNPNNAPINPDIIFVYLGINDYNFNRSNVGNGTVDYASLVNGDGTYATPATFGEAYGILLHKMQQAYPNAQIFAMTLLPENLYSVDKTAWEQHNAFIRAAAEYYDIPVVDLAEKCAITWDNYSGYMMDKIHPTTAGMKLISDCIETELLSYYQENLPHTHSYENGVCTGCGDSFAGKTISILGDSISTYTGVSNNSSYNSTIGGNAVYYTAGRLGVYQPDTWWQQTIDALGMELLVNNSWSGSCILHTRSGTVGAYVDRCVQLHNTAGEEPDVIAIFLGTNDVSYYQSKLGTAQIDYDALITHNGDGTYTYAKPATSCEAYAIMLHKISVRYPDAEVYCMTMLPRREEDYAGDSVADVGQPTEFNAELANVIDHFGATVVDLENCGITSDTATFDRYIGDKRVHPNGAGMDKVTQALIDAMMGQENASRTVSWNLVNVSADVSSGMVLNGCGYKALLSADAGFDSLAVTVTMGGKDITAEVYKDGVVDIPAVSGDVVITASASIADVPDHFYWKTEGSSLVNLTDGGHSANSATKKAGSIDDGVINNAYFQLEKPVVLRHDQPWTVEWRVSGTSWSGMLLSDAATGNAAGNQYLFKTKSDAGFVGFGESISGSYHNYGVALAAQGVDADKVHTYRVENRIAADGGNMAYLMVDGVDYGPMNCYFIGGNNDQGKQVNWLNGRDLCFSYIGAKSHTINNCKLEYLAVWEAHTHSYEAVVTAPTCAEQGYTTYICECGDSYVDSYTEATGIHSYVDSVCEHCNAIGGTCGENLTWTFDEEIGTLTISGTGAMIDYERKKAPWWSAYSKQVKHILFEGNITHIGSNAFHNCTSLLSVSIPNTLRTIGTDAFSVCTSLKSVYITDLVAWCNIEFANTHLLACGADLYYNGNLLTECIIPDGVTSISDNLFVNCNSLTSITIPSSVTVIGENAFEGCGNLRKVYIANGVTAIKSGAFTGCTNLNDINIPDSVTYIGSGVFSNCTSLTGIVIPEGVTFIGDSAFCGCVQLNSITIPNSITSIGNTAFAECAITSILIPKNVSCIDDYTFVGCRRLTSITIPDNIVSIGQDAFAYCDSLTRLDFQGDAPEFTSGCFYEVAATAYYSANNLTWTSNVMQDYGGTITWVPYGEGAHVHCYESIVTAPSCTEKGYTTYTCACGDSYVDSYVDAKGHRFENGVCTSCGAEREVEYFGRKALAQMDNSAALLYAYDRIAEGVNSLAEEISVYDGTHLLSTDEIQTVLDVFDRDHTYPFWIDGWSFTLQGGKVINVKPRFTLTGNELTAARELVETKVAEILSGITPDMDDYEKELYLHDVLAKGCEYVSGTNAHNIYGALVEGKAVCEGYANAFQYLLQRVGIQSFIIEGSSKGVGHAWNAVEIDGKFYQVDVTWDDQGEDLFHTYFNLTDARMGEDHSINTTAYALPVCGSEDAFYFTGKDTLLTTYDTATVGKLLKDNNGKVHVYIPGDVDAFLKWVENNILAIAQAAGVSGNFSYGYHYLSHEVILSVPKQQECTHNYVPAVTLPSGTEKGYTTYTCAECGDSYQTAWLDPAAYKGKTLACIGDSITAAYGVTKDETDYVTVLAETLGMNYIRLGVSGTTLCTDGSRTCNISKLTESNLNGADVVTIAMGINDFCAAGAGYYALGDINSTDTSNIYGAARMWCEKIQELRKLDSMADTQFYFLTPVITSWNSSVSSAKDWDQSKVNIHGYTLRDLCNAIIEVCALYDVPVIDLNLTSGLYYVSAEDNNTAMFGGDGVHPGATGHEMMADALEDALLQNELRDDHAHAYGSWITTDYPGCKEAGTQMRVCAECRATESRTQSATGHIYENIVTKPTCTEKGYTTHTCTICGDSYVDDNVNAVWHDYEDGHCSMCGCDMLRIGTEDIIRYQGGVNAENGTLNTTFTNNWYTDIRLPLGAKQVHVLTFKTGGNWGSAFLKGTTYVSGFCDKDKGGQWLTIDVPEEATIFRYGYLYDEIAQNNKLPTFQYLEFAGSKLEIPESSGFMERPATGCHSFTVEVNIAPAQGNPDGYVPGIDYGYIQLPTNYSPNGEPTRLIIVCHGAGASLGTYQSHSWKNTNYSFWTDLGYAVMDMYACPEALAGGSELHYGNPVVLECYKKGYEYVLEKFNLKQDGIFLIGSSMGGLSSFRIAQSGQFPVIAQVGYCPAIDLFKQAYCNPWTTASYQRSHIASYFGFAGTAPIFTNNRYPSAAEIEFYRQNLDKTIAYSPILRNVVDGDVASIFNVIPSSATAVNAEEAAIYAQLTATHPNPLLIFHNTDDGTVAYRYSQYFVDMVNRSGQEAKLYTFTSGAHNAWANGANYTVEGINGQITIKESQYEAYKFFEKFEKHEEHQLWVDPAVEPTCTETGLTEGKHCASCGEVLVKQNVVPAKGHSWDNGKVNKQPTEDTEGELVFTCTFCGETRTEIIPTLEHVHKYESVVTAPTCTEKGYTTHTCHCGHSYTDSYVNAKGHTEVINKATAPTCTATGLTEGKHCFVCNTVIVKQDIVPATGHSYKTVVTAPTCTERGYTTHTCHCGSSYVDGYVNAKGHTEVIDKAVAATCIATGLTEGKHCSVCGEVLVKQNVVAAKGHAEVVDKAVAATCTAAGLTEGKHCSICGWVLVNQNVVPAKGHSWDSGKVTVEPTEKSEGTKVFTCTACRETRTQTVPTLDHVHSYETKVTAPTCLEKGYTTHTCRCGDSYVDTYVDAKGHSEVIDKAVEATCTETGLTEGKHCSVCGEVLVTQNVVVAKGHTEAKIAGKMPTCTEAGLTKGTKCTVCGEILKAQQPIEALGHSFSDGKCTICGADDPNDVPPTEPEQPTEPVVPGSGTVRRLAGNSRYETSFSIANVLKETLGVDKFVSVILANSDNFADALAGSYLAAVKEAPIIIAKQKYAGIVCDYLNANLASGGTIYILGGEEAMPGTILDGMQIDYVPVRLAGADRYGTNLAILDHIPIGSSDLLVATGRDFADSLSASATGLPILLVNGKAGKSLSAEQREFLASVSGQIYILGGESAVPADLEAEINEASGQTATRISGAGRYETSVNIAKTFLPNAKSAVTAYASTFPDGLCGGPLAYAKGAPLLLTKDGKAEAPAYAGSKDITSGYVLGGESLISDGFAMDIFRATEILS